MKRFAVAIGREFGSGGGRIGRLLAEELGVPLYDRHLIEEASRCSGIDKEELERADEMAASRFLYSVPSKANRFTGYGKPMTDTLFTIQSQLILKYAAEGSCVLIGRCADQVLKDHENLLTVFIHAPAEARIRELAGRFHTDREESAYLMKQADKIRKNYYNYYTKKKWGEKGGYDMMLDSSRLTDREAAAALKAVVLTRLHETENG